MLTPEVRKGIEDLLASYTASPDTIAWLKCQLEADDWDRRLDRMGGGPKARNARMKPVFDERCSVTAFDMHAQLMTDGRERGLWLWLYDESKARAHTYDQWLKPRSKRSVSSPASTTRRWKGFVCRRRCASSKSSQTAKRTTLPYWSGRRSKSSMQSSDTRSNSMNGDDSPV